MIAYSIASIPQSCHPLSRAKALPSRHKWKVCRIHSSLLVDNATNAESDCAGLDMTASSSARIVSYVNQYFMPDLLWSLVLDLSTQNLSRDASGSLSCPPLAHQGARA